MKHLRKGYGLDTDGYIVRDVGLEKLSNDFQECIQETMEILQKKFPTLLHSVYVYGSAARGDAIKGKSDLDILVVFNRELQNGESVIIKKLEGDLSQKYHSLVREIGIAKTSIDYVTDPKNYYEQAFLRELCVCVDGEDLRGQFGPYKLTAEIAVSFNGDIREVSDRYLRRLKDANDLEFPTIVQGFARKLIRTFYSMVMARSQIWSTRLDEQSEIFLQHFPEKAPIVHTLQKWIIEVPKDHSKVLALLEEESKWVSDNFMMEATSID
jgi:predicted nucleotidyltransferase